MRWRSCDTEPHVEEVVLAHAKHVRGTSHAKVKTDKVYARVLAGPLAAGLVPAVRTGSAVAGSVEGSSQDDLSWKEETLP